MWIWCLLKANHRREWVPVTTGRGKTEIRILPGQFVFGRHAASKELRMEPSTVWKRIQKLKYLKILNIESNSQYSLITIVNWSTYQDSDKKSDSKSDNQVTTKEQPSDTYKNDKNDKKRNILDFSPQSPESFLSELLLSLILKRRPSLKSPNLQVWAKNIDLMIRCDNRSPEEIERVIRWVQADPFWQNNILSTDKLRKKFDQLALKMNQGKNPVCDDPKRGWDV